MKKKYDAPCAETFSLTTEGFMCMSFGGNGEGRPAESNTMDDNMDWNATDEIQKEEIYGCLVNIGVRYTTIHYI